MKIASPRYSQECSNISVSLALNPYDLALSKLERNIQRDRDDVKHLAKIVPFDLEVLKERYQNELRWQLGNPEREDLTLRLWIETIEEERSN
jgi:G:T-mismatch repair DNA endonuclease (very short patch repair protein)